MSRYVPTLFFLAIIASSPLAQSDTLLTEKLGCANILPRDNAGYYAFFNPGTGKLTSAPATPAHGMRLDPEDLYPFTTFHEGLVSKKTTENLTKLDLQGRFREGTIALLDRSGETHIVHVGGEMFLSEAGRCMRAAIVDRYRQGQIGKQR